MRNDMGTLESASTTAEKRRLPSAAAWSASMRWVCTACGACGIGLPVRQPATASATERVVSVLVTLLISNRPAQFGRGAPIRRKGLLVLELGVRGSRLRLEEVPEERGLQLVSVAGLPNLLRRRLVTA